MYRSGWGRGCEKKVVLGRGSSIYSHRTEGTWALGLRHGIERAGVGELGWSGKERWDQVMGTFVCCVEAFGYCGGVKGVKEMGFKVTKGCSLKDCGSEGHVEVKTD